VGANLQDHPRLPLTYASRRSLGFATPAEREQALRDYEQERTGPLSSNGIAAGALLRITADAPFPEVMIVPTASPAEGTLSLHVALLRPESRGTIRLRSADSSTPPLILAHYLSQERDLDILLRGLEMARRMASAQALAEYRGDELRPGSGGWARDRLRRYVRDNLVSFYHPVGTCAMGGDERAVVDASLRVRGVGGLRVIDASIMPTLIGGATHAATVVIAEKGADLLRSGR
jgi:choline dehydrogenase